MRRVGTRPASSEIVMYDPEPRKKCTVLVVDDETGPRESIRRVLAPYYNVLAASGGEEALEILSREEIDVVTLDLRMPGLDGTATLEQIRAMERAVEVIIVTAYGSSETVMDTIYLGAFSFLNKPFAVGEILQTVREACEVGRRDFGGGAQA